MILKGIYLGLTLAMFFFSYRFVWSSNSNNRRALGLIFLSIGTWNMFLLLSVSVQNEWLKIWLHELKYIGISTLMVHILLFALYFTNIGLTIKKHHLVALYLLPMGVMTFILTNEWHHLFRKHIWIGYRNGLGIVFADNGILFYIITGLMYGINFITFLICVNRIFNGPSFHRGKYYLLLTSITGPFIANLVYNSLGMNANAIDPTPIAMGISAFLMYYAYKIDKTFDVGSLARDQVFRYMLLPIIITNSDYVVNDMNSSAEDMFSVSLKASFGKPIQGICKDVLKLSELEIKDRIYEVIKDEIYVNGGELAGYSFLFQDETEKNLYVKKLQYLSYHDSLTQVYNKHYLREWAMKLDSALLPVGVLYGDMNALKQINDTYGHEEGDQLIIKMVQSLKRVIKENGFITRLGGDEFLIVLPALKDEGEIAYVADQIKAIEVSYDKVVSNFSVGYAIMRSIDESFLDVMKAADERMYQEKVRMKSSGEACHR